jgi:hypothetical protein
VTYIAQRHTDYTKEKTFADNVSAKLVQSLDAGNAAALRSAPEFADGETPVYTKLASGGAARKTVDEIMKDEFADDGHTLDVYLPIGRGQFIYLSLIPNSRYVDIRTLKYATDRKIVERLLKSKHGHQTGFYEYLRAPYRVAGYVKTGADGQEAIYLIKSEFGKRRTTFTSIVDFF